jgi:EAL domain
MGSLSRCDERHVGEEEVPGGEATLGWHPSRAKLGSGARRANRSFRARDRSVSQMPTATGGTSWSVHLDANDAIIVRSVIDLGHNLGLQTVAEGIEDSETWEELKSLGCDSCQGTSWEGRCQSKRSRTGSGKGQDSRQARPSNRATFRLSSANFAQRGAESSLAMVGRGGVA